MKNSQYNKENFDKDCHISMERQSRDPVNYDSCRGKLRFTEQQQSVFAKNKFFINNLKSCI